MCGAGFDGEESSGDEEGVPVVQPTDLPPMGQRTVQKNAYTYYSDDEDATTSLTLL